MYIYYILYTYILYIKSLDDNPFHFSWFEYQPSCLVKKGAVGLMIQQAQSSRQWCLAETLRC